MVAKGRARSGSKSKFTKEQKEELMGLKGIESCMSVATKFEISYSTVCKYWRGER